MERTFVVLIEVPSAQDANGVMLRTCKCIFGSYEEALPHALQQVTSGKTAAAFVAEVTTAVTFTPVGQMPAGPAVPGVDPFPPQMPGSGN